MKNFKKVFALILSIAMFIPLCTIFASALPTEINAGNSMATATNIPKFETEYVSSLSTTGEVDWFKFTTKSEDAYYYVNFENYDIQVSNFYDGSKGLNIYLYDKYNKQIHHGWIQEDGNTLGFNYRLENNTTYYLKIEMGKSLKSSIGNYEISVSTVFDNVPNTIEDSKTISFNKQVISTLDGHGDIDWYTFKTPATDTTYTFDFKNYDIPVSHMYNGSRCLNLYLYNSDDMQLCHNWIQDLNTGMSFTVDLKGNSNYYFKILMGSEKMGLTGKYEFTVKTDAVATEPDVTPDKPTDGLASIEITSLPTTLAYNYKDTVSLDGLAVYAHYADGRVVDVTADVTVTNFDTSSTGDKTATVEFDDKTATFDYKVSYAWWQWIILILLFGWIWY